MATTADRIKELREAKRLTQQQLSDRLHLSKQIISQWERGIKKPSRTNLEFLCDIFNVSSDYLLGKDDVTMRYLNSRELELIDLYRNADAGMQFAVDRLLGMKYTSADRDLLNSLVGDEDE